MKLVRAMTTCALVVGLGAATLSCSEDDPEPILPTSPSTPSSAPPSSEPTRERTEPWQEKSYDGAEAFATHWFDVFSEAMPTGDTTEMRAISDPECVNCDAYADLLEGWYEDGGYYKSKGWKVRQATYIRDTPLARAEVGLSIFRNGARVKHSAQSKETIDTPGTQAYEAHLRWTGNTWSMLRFEPIG